MYRQEKKEAAARQQKKDEDKARKGEEAEKRKAELAAAEEGEAKEGEAKENAGSEVDFLPTLFARDERIDTDPQTAPESKKDAEETKAEELDDVRMTSEQLSELGQALSILCK